MQEEQWRGDAKAQEIGLQRNFGGVHSKEIDDRWRVDVKE